jgi:hypothetical protein
MPFLKWFSAAALAGLLLSSSLHANTDPEARLEQLQKQMEDSVNRGQGVPPGLMKEMQALLDETMKDDAEDEPEPKLAWVSPPFRGQVTIRIQGSGSCSVKGGATFTADIDRTARAMVTGCREVRNEEGQIEEHIPLGTVQTQIKGRHTMVAKSEDCTVTALHSVSGSGRREMSKGRSKDVSVRLDPNRKVYTIHLPSGWARSEIFERITGCGADERRSSFSTVSVMPLPQMRGKEPVREYPYRSGTLAGSYSVPSWASLLEWQSITGAGAIMPEGDPTLEIVRKEGGAPYLLPVTVHVSWNLTLEGEDVEAVIEPIGQYEQWLPNGGYEGVGNTLKAKVRITKPRGAKGFIHFRLKDVSQVKGLCGNYPLSNPDGHPDLRFVKGGATKGFWIGPDGLEAKTEEEVNEAVVAVQALDYGAWGRLEAEIKVAVKGQIKETRAVYKPLGTDWLTLPKDDDEDHVADAWAEQMRIEENASDDNDAKPGKRFKGDGLSVYEEYRGFIVQGRHLRTDPRVKDLFVWDPDSLLPRSNISAGAFGPMQVHRVLAEEVKTEQGAQHRIINLNFDPDRHVVDQHALFIFIGDVASSGYTFESITNPRAKLGPPVLTQRIEINPAHILNLVNRIYFVNFKQEYARDKGPGWPDLSWIRHKLDETIAFAVAHEMAHGIGMQHHRPMSGPPHNCLMSQPKAGGTEGFCSYNLFRGDYTWGSTLCEQCLEQNMVSDAFESQGYLPAEDIP